MTFDMFMNEMVANVDVLGARVCDRVTSQGDATLVVSVDDGCIDSGISEIFKEYLEPNGFFRRICYCHVFCLNG